MVTDLEHSINSIQIMTVSFEL